MDYASENTSLHSVTCAAFCKHKSQFIIYDSNAAKTILRVAFVMKGGVKFNSMRNDILLELLVPYFRNNRVKYNDN